MRLSPEGVKRLLHCDVEGTAGYVVLAPLDEHDVVATLFDHVADVVLVASFVRDLDLLTGIVGAEHAHHQHVDTCKGARVK